MDNNSSDRWYFTEEKLENTPSRKDKIDYFVERCYRQYTANFIQELGVELQLTQLCINTAIVYVHRFYMFHSFTMFNCYDIALTALFVASKTEESFRRLERIILAAHKQIETKSDNAEFNEAVSKDIIFCELVLLATFGFDCEIEHPHLHIINFYQRIQGSKEFARRSYILASYTLILTTMCLQYKPTVVACFCIYLVYKWNNSKVPLLNKTEEWYLDIDPSVSFQLLEKLTDELVEILERCPAEVRKKVMSIGGNKIHSSSAPNIYQLLYTESTNSQNNAPQSHRIYDSTENILDSSKRHKSINIKDEDNQPEKKKSENFVHTAQSTSFPIHNDNHSFDKRDQTLSSSNVQNSIDFDTAKEEKPHSSCILQVIDQEDNKFLNCGSDQLKHFSISQHSVTVGENESVADWKSKMEEDLVISNQRLSSPLGSPTKNMQIPNDPSCADQEPRQKESLKISHHDSRRLSRSVGSKRKQNISLVVDKVEKQISGVQSTSRDIDT